MLTAHGVRVYNGKQGNNHGKGATMDTSKQVRAAIAYAGETISSIAEKAGTSRQNLTQRLNRNGLHPADLEKIAQAIGAEYISLFRFPDGKEI